MQILENYVEVNSAIIANALSEDSDNNSHTSYHSLLDSIKTSGCIINPIHVNHDEQGRYVVIEGNTRVQIYKEFLAKNIPGNWEQIPALVYEQLGELEKHEIRLQSHLVGPRDWNPYSKAKYLHKLSHSGLPMNQIISMCGGRASEINKYIQAYEYMEDYISKADPTGAMMIVYNELRYKAECHSIRYGHIKKWFLETFPEINCFTAEDYQELENSKQVA